MTLSPRYRRLCLTAHVATSVGWLGAEAVLLVLDAAGVAGTDPHLVYPAAALVATVLVAPLAVGALGTGLALGLGSRYGLVRYRWVATKLTLTSVMTGLVLFVLVPLLRAAGADPAGVTAAERRQLLIAPCVATSLLLVNLVLAVYKPGGRIRPPRAVGPERAAAPAGLRDSRIHR